MNASSRFPESATAVLEQLALQQIRLGNLQAATQIYRQAIRQGGATAAAYSNLAALELKGGDIQTAETLLQEALRLAPNNAEAWLNLGTAQHALSQYQSAANSFRKASSLKPGLAKAYANLGNTLQAIEDFEGALEAYETALQRQPNYPEVLSGRGIALRELGRFHESIHSLKQALALKSDYAEALNNLGLSLQDAGRIQEAIHHFQLALKVNSSQPEIISNLGLALMEQGQIEQAREYFQHALRINPLYAEAHRNLAYCINGRNDQQAELEAAACLDQLGNKDNRFHVHFAIGKYKLDRNEDEATRWFCEGNRLREEQLKGRWQLPELSELLKFNQRVLSNEPPGDTLDTSNTSDPKLIFIVGLPRSGSTLLETILSQNQQLADLGEVPYLTQALQHSQSLRQIRSRYLRLATAHTKETLDSQFISDKFLYNFAYCPILAKAFPDCRILHTYRNPMDNLWSTFTNCFAKGNEWTYSLQDSINFYHLYRQIMSENEKLIPGRIYHINYDRLTLQPEKEIPKLIEHCGFQWDEAYMHPERSYRQIHTASAVQARSPINARSVGRWMHYRELLQPYADQLEQLGYSTEIMPLSS